METVSVSLHQLSIITLRHLCEALIVAHLNSGGPMEDRVYRYTQTVLMKIQGAYGGLPSLNEANSLDVDGEQSPSVPDLEAQAQDPASTIFELISMIRTAMTNLRVFYYYDENEDLRKNLEMFHFFIDFEYAKRLCTDVNAAS